MQQHILSSTNHSQLIEFEHVAELAVKGKVTIININKYYLVTISDC